MAVISLVGWAEHRVASPQNMGCTESQPRHPQPLRVTACRMLGEERVAGMEYLNFDLLVERAADGYVARVLACPAGQASADFYPPFSDLELENFVLRMGRPRRAVRRRESPEMEMVKQFGGRLFDAVFRGDVRACLRSSLDGVQREGKGLRIRLHLAAPELADLPWEYLYNSTLNRFLSLSIGTPVVRYLELPLRIEPLAVSPPLRVLVMIASPEGCPTLDVEREWRVLKDAVRDLEQQGRVILERLPQGQDSLATLQRHLRRKVYHVFHFIGHGGYDERAEDGVLLLEDKDRRPREVSGQHLGMLLHDERTLRLAILNACEGARSSRTDPFAGTAQSLVQQGIPAVIAMQFEITDEAAITLAQEFYGALADGYPVDAALAEARKALFAQGNEVEWGKPVLYLRAPDGRIFDIDTGSEQDRHPPQVLGEKERQEKANLLYSEAKAAIARDGWTTAIGKLEEVIGLEPADVSAAAALKRARQEQELATLYARGREGFETGRWRAAQDDLRRVKDMQEDYRDVGALLASIEKEMAPAAAPRWFSSIPPGSRRWLRVVLPAILGLVIIGLAVGLLVRACGPAPVSPWDLTATEVARVVTFSVEPATATAAWTVTPTPTPIATRTLAPTFTFSPPATPTLAPKATDTPAPTPTFKVSPTTTPTPAPRSTDTPTPTTTPTPVPPMKPTSTDTPAPTTPPTEALNGHIYFPLFDQDRKTYDILRFDLSSGEREIVTEQSSQLALSPDGQRLAYRIWDRDNRGIWGLDLSEGNSWPWTELDQAARPSWSPDNQNIVVASHHEPGEQWRLYRSDTGFASLPRESGDSDGATPAWLAGDKIVHRACSPGGCGLYVMRSNGSNLLRLTAGENDRAPAGSPDGGQIAFMSDRDGNWEIYIINVGGTGLRRLTNNASSDGLPAWSPDGRRIAFVTDRDGPWFVWAMRPDGSEQRELFPLYGSLEGKIAYVPDDQQQGWTWEAIAWGP